LRCVSGSFIGAAFAMHAATWVAMVDTKVAVVLVLVVPGYDLEGVEASGSGGLDVGKKGSRWGRGTLGLSARAVVCVCTVAVDGICLCTQ